ncbi:MULTISPECIES: DsbA family protein [unclassified Rhizobium]|jgi:protein-disulfide isomerase|uniref:DsbA family protein n=1 Tax=unclassified Rhizobium TaxID=2613769 RepID=UPI000648C3D5|nr:MULTISPECIES: DsbA family protein [unclassified Rhizobium]MBN8954212.1 DsbA family protein [Rhizobium tropici]OJY70895.1 MAG: disulfide bond formation protein DsbA [Rhizobium sp. 60-20]RKD50744.1 protein-disulfide isomerase [Rhizobium sp. WW_1]
MNVTRRHFVAIAGLAAVLPPSLAFASKAPTDRDMVLDDPDAPVLCNPKGDVTVVEYFDYQCPYCKKSYEMVREVVEQDGKVKLVMKDWPVFGGASVIAAQAVLATAKLGMYEETLDAMFHTPAKLQQTDMEKALAKTGLTFDVVGKAVVKNQAWISSLLDRNWIQASAFKFVGTPSFVVGSTTFAGVLDRKGLKDAIAKARG